LLHNDDEIQDVLEIAKEDGFTGFGGACGVAAIAINRVLFDGKGQFVGAFNKAFEAHGNSIGHVAVLHEGVYWDADAEPKERDDIESFGMLAPDDPDYKKAAKALGFRFNDKKAHGVVVRENLKEADVLGRFVDEDTDPDQVQAFLERMEEILREALAEHLRWQAAVTRP
jgi:hypothetical protein